MAFETPDDSYNGNMPTGFFDLDAGSGNTITEIAIAIEPGDNFLGQERLVSDGTNTFRQLSGTTKEYRVIGLLTRFVIIGIGTVDNLSGHVVNEAARNIANMQTASRPFKFRSTYGVTTLKLRFVSYGQTARVFLERANADSVTDLNPSSPYGWMPMQVADASPTVITSEGTTPSLQVNDTDDQLPTDSPVVYTNNFIVPNGTQYAKDATSQEFYRLDDITKDFMISVRIDFQESFAAAAVIFDTGAESASGDVLAGGGYSMQLRQDNLLQFRVRAPGGTVDTVFSRDITDLIGEIFTFQVLIRVNSDRNYYDAIINGSPIKSDTLDTALPSLTTAAGITLFGTARSTVAPSKLWNAGGESNGISCLQFIRFDANQRGQYIAMSRERFGTQLSLPRAGAGI